MSVKRNEPDPYVILDIGRRRQGSLSDDYEMFKRQLGRDEVLVCLSQRATNRREGSAEAMCIEDTQAFARALQAEGFASKKFYAVPKKRYEEYMNC